MNKFLKVFGLSKKQTSEIHTTGRYVDVGVVKYEFKLDSPVGSIQSEKTVLIRGWLTVDETSFIKIRIRNKSTSHDIPYGIKREDVARARPSKDATSTLLSGFEYKFEFEDGAYFIEADFGDGFILLCELKLIYSPERLYESYYNPTLANNNAEQRTLMDAKVAYFSENVSEHDYIRSESDPRLVAFYLPQFHPIQQNDMAWGKGFTEWRNVTTAEPRFIGHEQPILPGDLGYYDLRNQTVIKDQIDLAKKYGIYGFCFYYYWFSGEKILDTPINSFMEHQEWDFNFMICWANENWTKRWDGRDQDVIISQKYLEDDPLKFIKDVEHILLDPRYIKENGKPILAVYRGSELIKPERYIDEWRGYFRNKHGMELQVVSMMNFDASDPRPYGFDAGIEFSPLTMYRKPDFNKKRSRVKDIGNKLLDLEYTGSVVDYRALLPIANNYKQFDFPTYKSVSPSWDNDARKKGKKSLTLYASNPDMYGKWLSETLHQESGMYKSPLIFINAWNEWAEGAMLEPTLRYGHANLLRTAEVLGQFSDNPRNAANFPYYGLKSKGKMRVAIVIHIFYENEWNIINEKLSKITTRYDLYITISPRVKRLRELIKKDYKKATIIQVPNRGRDVLPFVTVMNRISNQSYEFILKIHTKRTIHRSDGSEWFVDTINSLIGSDEIVRKIINEMDKGVALVGPKGHYISLWDNMGDKYNKKVIYEYMEKITGNYGIPDSTKSYGFFGGTMFWCRTDSLSSITKLMLCPEDFESEQGQIDATLAHVMERIFSIIPVLEKKDIAQSDGKVVTKISHKDVITKYKYNEKS